MTRGAEMANTEEKAQNGSNDGAWPTELRLASDRRALTISFESGESFTLSAEYLRVESPSAEVQGHGPSERKFIPGKRLVEILKIEPVGHYAVRLVFDDMHDTGLYTWDYLRKLGLEHDARWQVYNDALVDKGLSRDPKPWLGK